MKNKSEAIALDDRRRLIARLLRHTETGLKVSVDIEILAGNFNAVYI